MSRTRLWSVATAGVCALVLVAAWFLAIGPKRAEASELRVETVAQQQANDLSRLKTQQLKAQFAQLPARQAELAVVKRQLPPTASLPTLVRDLTALARQAGVTLVSVSPQAPVPFVPAGAPVTAAGTAASPLVKIATTVAVRGDFASVTLFLQRLQAAGASPAEGLTRALLVNQVAVTPAEDDPSAKTKATKGDVTMTVTGQVYVLGGGTSTTVTPAAPSVVAPSAVAPSTGVSTTPPAVTTGSAS